MIQVFGPIAGAGLFALIGPHAVVLVCVGLFALAGLLILCVRLPGTGAGHVDGVLAGLAFVLRRPGLSQAVGSLVVIQMSLGFVDASLYALVEAMGRAPQFSGVVVGMQGVGAIIGGFGSAAVVRRLGEIRSMVLGLVSTVICLVLLVVLVHQVPVVLVVVGVAGAVMTLAMTSFSILFQRLTPENVIGRAQAAVAALQSVPAVVAVAVGSILVGLVDFRLLYLATALTVLVSAVLLFGSTRRLDLSESSGEAG